MFFGGKYFLREIQTYTSLTLRRKKQSKQKMQQPQETAGGVGKEFTRSSHSRCFFYTCDIVAIALFKCYVVLATAAVLLAFSACSSDDGHVSYFPSFLQLDRTAVPPRISQASTSVVRQENQQSPPRRPRGKEKTAAANPQNPSKREVRRRHRRRRVVVVAAVVSCLPR